MSQFFLGQIMMTGFGFAPKFWAQCNGQLLSVAQNQALFALLGTYYGGNGSTNFALPDLRSRTPAGGGFPSSDPGWQPTPYVLGQVAGQESVTLLQTELPVHTHIATATSAAGDTGFGSNTVSFATITPTTGLLYGAMASATVLAPQTVTPTGGNSPHPNIQPFQTINFNVALSGIFPSRN